MNIIFVRHGETNWNTQKRLQGQTNESRLNENGIKQANIIGKKLSDFEYDVIISSPLERAIETAKIINRKNNKNIIVNNDIRERGYGELEGAYTTHNQIERMWDNDNIEKENGIEPVDKFLNRIHKFLDNLIEEKEYQNVLIVAHDGVGIATEVYFNKNTNNKKLLSYSMKNCEMRMYNVN